MQGVEGLDPQAGHTRKSQSNSDAAIAQKFLPQDKQTQDEQRGAPSGDAATGADPVPGSGRDTAEEATTRDDATTDDPAQSAADDTDARDRAPAGSAAALSWYGDSAYGTGELRGEIERAGHRAVIKPKPVQPAGSPSTTSPSMRAAARSPARPARPGRCRRPGR